MNQKSNLLGAVGIKITSAYNCVSPPLTYDKEHCHYT